MRARAPHVSESLARDVAEAVAPLRELDLAKLPGVAETIDWANALAFLGADGLTQPLAVDTLGAVVKDHEDHQLVAPASPRSSARMVDRTAVPGDGGGGRSPLIGLGRDLRARGLPVGTGRILTFVVRRRPRAHGPRFLLGRAHHDGRPPRRPRRRTTWRSTTGTGPCGRPTTSASSSTSPCHHPRATTSTIGYPSPTISRYRSPRRRVARSRRRRRARIR